MAFKPIHMFGAVKKSTRSLLIGAKQRRTLTHPKPAAGQQDTILGRRQLKKRKQLASTIKTSRKVLGKKTASNILQGQQQKRSADAARFSSWRKRR